MSAEDRGPDTRLLDQQIEQALDKRIHAGQLGGGRGGDMNGLVKRVETLEDALREIRADLKTLMRDVAETKGRIGQLPTTWQLIGVVIGILGLSFIVIRFGLPAN